MPHHWTEKEIKILRELWPNNSAKAIAKKMRMRPEQIKSKGANMKLLKAPGYNRNVDRTLSVKEIEFIRENYLKIPTPVLVKMMGRGESTIQSYARQFGYIGKKVNTGCIKKGNVPPNKGKKMPPGWGGRGIETRFKKGQVSKNLKELGTITVRRSKGRPYVWVKIGDKKWELLQRVVWERTIGPISKGVNIQFKDGNTLNCEASNLYSITRDKQMLQNQIHRYDPELQQIMRLVGKLRRKIKEHEKQN